MCSLACHIHYCICVNKSDWEPFADNFMNMDVYFVCFYKEVRHVLFYTEHIKISVECYLVYDGVNDYFKSQGVLNAARVASVA